MRTTKITFIGLLVCLTSIFYHDEYWIGIAGLEFLPDLARYGFPFGLIIAIIGLFTDKAHFIDDSKNSFDETDEKDINRISKTLCPSCHKKHDID